MLRPGFCGVARYCFSSAADRLHCLASPVVEDGLQQGAHGNIPVNIVDSAAPVFSALLG